MNPEVFSNLMMQFAGFAGWEWVIIVSLVVVVFFGVKKIPEIARSLGKASTEYEKARIQARNELQDLKVQRAIRRDKLESIAHSLGIDYANKDDEAIKAAIMIELDKAK